MLLRIKMHETIIAGPLKQAAKLKTVSCPHAVQLPCSPHAAFRGARHVLQGRVALIKHTLLAILYNLTAFCCC